MSDLYKTRKQIMRNTILKSIGFFLLIVILVYINMWVFRSEFPLAWFITFIGSVVGLVLFPYKTFFNNK